MNNTPPRTADNNILVFSIALNGYQWLYQALSATHQAYADQHGYRYIQVQRPWISTLGREVCWLKVCLALASLRSGYEWVVFLDADTRVSACTPKIESLEQSGRHLYVAKGYSGRLNSGVLIMRRHPDMLKVLQSALAIATQPVAKECDVGWGENGHLIQLCRQAQFVHYLDQKWNNNHNPELQDYIRHFSAGPMHQHHQAPLPQRVIARSIYFGARVLQFLRAHPTGNDVFIRNLERLSANILSRYPDFLMHHYSHQSKNGLTDDRECSKTISV
ncbi:MAG: hypothetical protein CMK89_14195 [Pseudomonadales bacterium]|nr:hypothetical protein [Pseudomonadales bacterium]